jgi:hypothetical protein
VHVTGFIDTQDGPATKPLLGTRRSRPQVFSELEAELRRLYLRLMDEPIPSRMRDVLRTRSTGKS